MGRNYTIILNVLVLLCTICFVFGLVSWRNIIPIVKYITIDKVKSYCKSNSYCNVVQPHNIPVQVIYDDFDCIKCYEDCGFEKMEVPDYLMDNKSLDCIMLKNKFDDSAIQFNKCYDIATIDWNSIESEYLRQPNYSIWWYVTLSVICILSVLFILLCYTNYKYIKKSKCDDVKKKVEEERYLLIK